MPNRLKAALLDTIQSLRQRGWSQRRIARELGIDRETVARHLRQAAAPAKPAIAPTGSPDADGAAKPAIAPIGSTDTVPGLGPAPAAAEHQAAGRPSDCAPRRGTLHAQPHPRPS